MVAIESPRLEPGQTPMERIEILVKGALIRDFDLEAIVSRYRSQVSEMTSYSGYEPDANGKPLDVKTELDSVYLDLALHVQQSNIDNPTRWQILSIIESRIGIVISAL